MTKYLDEVGARYLISKIKSNSNENFGKWVKLCEVNGIKDTTYMTTDLNLGDLVTTVFNPASDGNGSNKNRILFISKYNMFKIQINSSGVNIANMLGMYAGHNLYYYYVYGIWQESMSTSTGFTKNLITFQYDFNGNSIRGMDVTAENAKKYLETPVKMQFACPYAYTIYPTNDYGINYQGIDRDTRYSLTSEGLTVTVYGMAI